MLSLFTFNKKFDAACCISIASCSMYCPFIKKTKSFSDTAVRPSGAEAVTALKLAVAGIVIDDEVLTNCFLKKDCCVSVELSTKVLAAFSVIRAVELPSVRDVSFDTSFTVYWFRIKEPVVAKLPVKLWVSAVSSPNFVEPLLKTIVADTKTVFNSCAVIIDY